MAAFLAIVVIAGVAGFFYSFAQPKLLSIVPGGLTGNVVSSSIVNGLIILISIMVSVWVMRLFFGKRSHVPGL